MLLLKYASKKAVLQYSLQHLNKKSFNANLKLLQQLLRKHKTELENDVIVKPLWKERQKEVKSFMRWKKIEGHDLKLSHSTSSSSSRHFFSEGAKAL